jgi:hypothetical protein
VCGNPGRLVYHYQICIFIDDAQVGYVGWLNSEWVARLWHQHFEQLIGQNSLRLANRLRAANHCPRSEQVCCGRTRKPEHLGKCRVGPLTL